MLAVAVVESLGVIGELAIAGFLAVIAWRGVIVHVHRHDDPPD